MRLAAFSFPPLLESLLSYQNILSPGSTTSVQPVSRQYNQCSTTVQVVQKVYNKYNQSPNCMTSGCETSLQQSTCSAKRVQPEFPPTSSEQWACREGTAIVLFKPDKKDGNQLHSNSSKRCLSCKSMHPHSAVFGSKLWRWLFLGKTWRGMSLSGWWKSRGWKAAETKLSSSSAVIQNFTTALPRSNIQAFQLNGPSMYWGACVWEDFF